MLKKKKMKETRKKENRVHDRKKKANDATTYNLQSL